MKIGITCYATYGGSGVLATELGKALAQHGHQVHFITNSLPYRLNNIYNENIFFHPVELMDYPVFKDAPYSLVLASKLAEIAKQEELDLIHAHYAIPHATSAFLAQAMLAPKKLPIVTTLHGTDITLVGKHPSFYDLTCFSIRKSSVVTAVSDYLKQETIKTFNLDCEIERIHNFLDLNTFKKDAKVRKGCQGFSDEKIIFLHYSNFRPVKGPRDVVEAFNIISQQIPNTELLLAGEGPELNFCRDLVKKYDLGAKVRFLGNQEDVVSILSLADVLLCPSKQESFGLVVLEGMACELPVIASNAGGIPEVIDHGKTGFMVDVGDYQGMAEIGIELAKNCELRKQIGISARNSVAERFTIEKIVPQYERIYQKAINLENN